MKILLSSLIILLLFAVTSAVSITRIYGFNRDVNTTLVQDLKLLDGFKKLQFGVVNRTSLVRAYLLSGNPRYLDLFANYTAQGQTIRADILQLQPSQEIQKLLDASVAWSEYIQKDVLDVYAQVGKDAALKNNIEKAGPQADAMIVSFNELVAGQQAKVDALLEQVDRNGKSLIALIALLSVIAVVVGITVSLLIAGQVVKPILAIAARIQSIAGGQLAGEPVVTRSKDEVGRLAAEINGMQSQLRHLIGQTIDTAGSLSLASQEISASTEEVAHGSQTQADSAQHVNELFKELTVATESVAKSAEQAALLAEQTRHEAEQGGGVVHSSIESMKQLSGQVSVLEEDSGRIGEIIEVIDEIADQTNLLALNAAIEAARAGDQGRGFAVVAGEVRKLAERSREATKQIAAIIKQMQSNTKESVDAVVLAQDFSVKTAQAFETIIGKVNQVTQQVTDIAAASEEQAAQASDVLLSIESIAAASEQSAASAQETASVSQSLSKMSGELQTLVNRFTI